MLNFHTYKRLFCANCDVIPKLKSFKAVRDRNQVLLDCAEMIQVYMAGGSTYAILWKHFPQLSCLTN